MKNLFLLILFSLFITIKAQNCSQTAVPNYIFYPNTTSSPSFTNTYSTIYLCGTNTILYDTTSANIGCRTVYVNAGAKYQTNNIANCVFSNFIYAKSSSTVVLTNNAHGIIYYEPGATIVITATSTGGINQNSCTAISFPTVNCIASGLNELNVKEYKLKVFPNPANDVLTIEVADAELSRSGSFKLQITNSLGQVIREEVLRLAQQPDGMYKTTINTKELANGVYVLKMASPSAYFGVAQHGSSGYGSASDNLQTVSRRFVIAR